MGTEATVAELRDRAESADAGERTVATLELIARGHYLAAGDAQYAARVALTGAHARRVCDICGDEIVAGERFTDDGQEVTHNACVAQWFRGNFGRESLS